MTADAALRIIEAIGMLAVGFCVGMTLVEFRTRNQEIISLQLRPVRAKTLPLPVFYRKAA